MKTHKDKIIQFEHIFKQRGLKLTPQRSFIYNELLKSKSHPSADAIYKKVKKRLPCISLDTVYRTLVTLQEHGIVKRIDTTESQARFDADLSNHHHFICSKCNAIFDVNWHDFDSKEIPDEVKDVGEVYQKVVTFHGLCKKCF
ncbi:MAG: transcriptional repressor [Thermodesulfovibrionales bacterium]|nr:transcriptional repressor [Thermodesulfovibrionales bacterium]